MTKILILSPTYRLLKERHINHIPTITSYYPDAEWNNLNRVLILPSRGTITYYEYADKYSEVLKLAAMMVDEVKCDHDVDSRIRVFALSRRYSNWPERLVKALKNHEQR